MIRNFNDWANIGKQGVGREGRQSHLGLKNWNFWGKRKSWVIYGLLLSFPFFEFLYNYYMLLNESFQSLVTKISILNHVEILSAFMMYPCCNADNIIRHRIANFSWSRVLAVALVLGWLWEEGFKLFSMTVILALNFFTYSVTYSGLIIGGPNLNLESWILKPGVDGSFLKLLRLFKTLINLRARASVLSNH